MAGRASRAVDEMFLPYASGGGGDEVNVAVVSHGLFIRELVSAFLRRGTSNYNVSDDYRGLKNTAWVRIKVQIFEVNVLNMYACDNETDSVTVII